MSNEIVIENDREVVKERINGHPNGQVSNKTLSRSDPEVIEEETNSPQNVPMSWELLRQFRKHGVTVAFPVDFADAISPQRGKSGKDKDRPPERSNGHLA
jgi:hypothetical protein